MKAVATRKAWIAALALGLALARPAGGAEIIPPAPTRYFNDYAQAVSPATADRLNRTLEDFEKATSSQVVVAIFSKMQSDSAMEDYTVRLFQAWKVGQKGKDNGAVLFVFVQDRRMRIEVGYGLEGALPDALAKRIIEDEIKPSFQRNDFDGGLTAGVTAMLQAVRGEYTGTDRTVAQQAQPAGKNRSFPIPLIVLFFVVAALLNAMGRRRGVVYHRRGRTSWGAGWGGGGWSSGGGGFSGGGFSGGGGRSGGGGASGSW